MTLTDLIIYSLYLTGVYSYTHTRLLDDTMTCSYRGEELHCWLSYDHIIVLYLTGIDSYTHTRLPYAYFSHAQGTYTLTSLRWTPADPGYSDYRLSASTHAHPGEECTYT